MLSPQLILAPLPSNSRTWTLEIWVKKVTTFPLWTPRWPSLRPADPSCPKIWVENVCKNPRWILHCKEAVFGKEGLFDLGVWVDRVGVSRFLVSFILISNACIIFGHFQNRLRSCWRQPIGFFFFKSHIHNLHPFWDDMFERRLETGWEVWKKISKQVEKLLEAANWAPTHHRNEPWRWSKKNLYLAFW